MFYHSPTYGKVDLNRLKNIISDFMSQNKKARYEIVVGTDSQKVKKDVHDFVSALIVHRVGFGGIYFWKRQIVERKISLKERIYLEASMSLETSENFINFFKVNGISRYNIQIHVDIGHNGETRDMITEVVGMVRGSGYDVKIKPDSYGASKVADRYT
ncbi:hypothetical protein A3C98_02050 [Candidatus Roizmanbacteria bacterium RIFCSPHIGHO2_02_FULL_37_15]|uniref:DUF458 domain-containing protein n=1 Tax=Candidatus Roizmanbacteria bacterium RIFCSPLOWO2_01_FULL_37_16 TaxID=1802058 RepID=A0A1F7IMS3_9BACT